MKVSPPRLAVLARGVFAAALVALFPGCAPGAPEGLESDSGQAREAIVGGALDSGDAAVVAVVARRARCAGGAALTCSGVLVSPRVVLTAGHCLRGAGTYGGFEVFFGASLSAGKGTFVLAGGAAVHPQWDGAGADFDLGLLRLAEPAPAPAVPVKTPLPGADLLKVGVGIRAVGFGATAAEKGTDGDKREGALVITEVGSSMFRAGPDPAMSCRGDSGGPVLVVTAEGESLAGITSGGDDACASEARQARVDVAWDDFVMPYVLASDGAPPLPAGTVMPENLCKEPCAGDADCPAWLSCLGGEDGDGRCQLPGGVNGNLQGACATDSDCGQGRSCQRLSPDGPDACSCSTPCDGLGAPPPDPAPQKGGCSLAQGGSRGAPEWPALVLLGLWIRSAARRRGGKDSGRSRPLRQR